MSHASQGRILAGPDATPAAAMRPGDILLGERSEPSAGAREASAPPPPPPPTLTLFVVPDC